MSDTPSQARQARPYKITVALTQGERDDLVKSMLMTKMDEPTILLAALNNLFYTLERAKDGYDNVSFVNKDGEVYSAPLIEIPGGS